jgi:glutamine cyclotransferase
VDGQVWANVFPTDQIARIDPLSGKVTAVVGARIYNDPARTKDQVLNGIAYAGAGDFLLTGKNWPVMYRVRFDSLGGK